jgi:hypothetical protein
MVSPPGTENSVVRDKNSTLNGFLGGTGADGAIISTSTPFHRHCKSLHIENSPQMQPF